MQNKIDPMLWVWTGFTALLAVGLTVNGIQAMFGHAKFASWHLFTLAMSSVMSLAYWSEAPVELRVTIIRFAKAIKEKAAEAYLNTIRVVRSLPTLFSFTFNRFRTEP